MALLLITYPTEDLEGYLNENEERQWNTPVAGTANDGET